MIFKIVAIGVCSVVLNIILKQYKPEYAILTNVCGALIIFMLITDGVSQIVFEFINLQNEFGVNINIVEPVLKVVGVGYLTEFTSDIAEDGGNKLMADKIVLGGKIAICVLALPIIKNLVNTILLLV